MEYPLSPRRLEEVGEDEGPNLRPLRSLQAIGSQTGGPLGDRQSLHYTFLMTAVGPSGPLVPEFFCCHGSCSLMTSPCYPFVVGYCSSPKKAHKHKEMGPQNWTLDPTPKTPSDPPPRNSLCTVFCWENQHLHKEFGRLSPLLDPPARVPPKFFMQIFFGCFFRS